MCGIAGVYLRKPTNLAHVDFSAVSRELLFAIDDRGGDACGYVATDMDGGLYEQKAACPAIEFEKEMRPMPDNIRSLLLHTRLATQGNKAFPENNHPVKSGAIRVIHNGMIYNDDEVFTTTDLPRAGRVDSEAIAAIINSYGWERAVEGLEQLEGSFAIAAISEEHPGELLLAKGDWSPLVVAVRPSFIMWASTVAALNYTWKTCIGTVPTWKNIDHMGTGEFYRVTADNKIENGKFNAYKRKYRSSTYMYTAANEDDYESWFTPGGEYTRSDSADGRTFVYYKNGQRYEYNTVTQTEVVTGEVCDPREHPLRTWVTGLVGRGTQRLELVAGEKPVVCYECGWDVPENIEKVGEHFYCDDCLDWITSLGAEQANDSKSPAMEREQADSIHNTRGTIPAEAEDAPDQFCRCPDCFDYFQIGDMVVDSNELVCKACAEIAGQMSSYGVSWRRNA